MTLEALSDDSIDLIMYLLEDDFPAKLNLRKSRYRFNEIGKRYKPHALKMAITTDICRPVVTVKVHIQNKTYTEDVIIEQSKSSGTLCIEQLVRTLGMLRYASVLTLELHTISRDLLYLLQNSQEETKKLKGVCMLELNTRIVLNQNEFDTFLDLFSLSSLVFKGDLGGIRIQERHLHLTGRVHIALEPFGCIPLSDNLFDTWMRIMPFSVDIASSVTNNFTVVKLVHIIGKLFYESYPPMRTFSFGTLTGSLEDIRYLTKGHRSSQASWRMRYIFGEIKYELISRNRLVRIKFSLTKPNCREIMRSCIQEHPLYGGVAAQILQNILAENLTYNNLKHLYFNMESVVLLRYDMDLIRREERLRRLAHL